MDRAYVVRGVNPFGQVVELRLIAPDDLEAKRMAESAGLMFVLVSQADVKVLIEQVSEAPPSRRAPS